MTETKCGFDNMPSASGSQLLALYGPTLKVDIGFDPHFKITKPPSIPTAGVKFVDALVDTGASESCIDNLLATKLSLPIIDQKPIAGSNGAHLANIYLAQIHVPALGITIYGTFAGVNLLAGGQVHCALIGRTFLQNFTMIYEGGTGTVRILKN